MSAKKDTQHNSITALHRLEFILQQKSDTLLRDSVGVGFGQVQIMQALHRAAPQSQRAVAATLYQTEANVSRQLQLLKRKGLVSIARNKNDRRLREVSLTTKGRSLYDKAQDILSDQHRQMLKLLDKSQLQSFDQVVSNLLRAL